jgi:hypothetical protein
MTIKEFVTLLGFKTDTGGLAAYDEALTKTFARAEGLNQGIKKLADGMIHVGNRMTLFLTTPIVGFGVAAVMAQNKLENMNNEWGVMLGTMDKGKEFVDNIMRLEENTPFETDQISAYLKNMHALGTEENKLLPTFQKYADISAGTGLPVDMMITRFSMMKNMAREMGFVMGRDIKGLIRSNILSKSEMTSILGITNLSKIPGQIKMTAEQVERLMDVLGGKYAGSAEKRAQTTAKAINNLMHSFFRLRAAVGEVLVKKLHLLGILKTLTGALEKATEWVGKLDNKKKNWIITIAGLLAVLGPAIVGIGLLVKGFAALKGIMMVFGGAGAAATGWIVLITAGIIGLLLLFDDIYFWVKKGAEHSFYGTAIMGFFKMVKDWVAGIINQWLSGIDAITNYFRTKWQAVSDWYMGLPGMSALVAAGGYMHQGVNAASSVLSSKSLMTAGANAGVSIGNIIVSIPDATQQTISMVQKAVKESATSAYDEVVKGITNSIYNHVKK